MIKWLIAIVFVIALAGFAAWFSNRYLCNDMPESSRLCFGHRP